MKRVDGMCVNQDVSYPTALPLSRDDLTPDGGRVAPPFVEETVGHGSTSQRPWSSERKPVPSMDERKT